MSRIPPINNDELRTFLVRISNTESNSALIWPHSSINRTSNRLMNSNNSGLFWRAIAANSASRWGDPRSLTRSLNSLCKCWPPNMKALSASIAVVIVVKPLQSEYNIAWLIQCVLPTPGGPAMSKFLAVIVLGVQYVSMCDMVLFCTSNCSWYDLDVCLSVLGRMGFQTTDFALVALSTCALSGNIPVKSSNGWVSPLSVASSNCSLQSAKCFSMLWGVCCSKEVYITGGTSLIGISFWRRADTKIFSAFVMYSSIFLHPIG